MVNPFEPLASLVAVAVSRHGRLCVIAPGSAAGPTNAVPPSVDRPVNRHDLEAEVVVADERWDHNYSPFENRPLYHLVSRDVTRVIWVGRNCHSPSMPPPPVADGQVVCACPDVNTGGIDGRYGPLTDASVFERQQYTDADYCAPFTPDVLSGYGPCAARQEPGFFTQWNSAWVERAEDGQMYWTERFKAKVNIVEETDCVVARALRVPTQVLDSVPFSASSEQEMKRYWACYVVAALKRRAQFTQMLVTRGTWHRLSRDSPATWATIREEGYFKTGALGAWFTDPNTYARRTKMLELIRLGVPVFYRWSPSLEAASAELQLPEEARFFLDDIEDYPSNLTRAAPPAYSAAATASAPPAATNTGPVERAGPDDGMETDDESLSSTSSSSGEAPASASASLAGDAALQADRSNDSLTDPFDDHTWGLIADQFDEIDEANARPANAAPPPNSDLEREEASNRADDDVILDEDDIEPTAPVPVPTVAIPFPTEGYHFYLIHGSVLSSRLSDQVNTIPCRRVDNQVQRILHDDSAFLSELAPPRSRVYVGDDNTHNLDVVDGGAVAIAPC
ncbi:hypothetical protein AURDEDRAFT_175023 [Auricularia subglabra TFB-10046 SS5]|nr:hypothetical protein AURDEDRAFT_175023 [Auricularia subglabra TFB-10046 SS5]